MKVREDIHGNKIREFCAQPGRPARLRSQQQLQQQRALAIRKQLLDKQFEKLFRPSFSWSSSGRPKSEWSLRYFYSNFASLRHFSQVLCTQKEN
jgi:hypothetical protein